ncbi:hypothetical protein LTR53_001361 [Teratosphaeriaceae sp. CCFEE 6253]|nr:hypothetical protein LTR53_001361 [Teratosphaeriaceae sp. CCFEE 6253]
MTNLVTPKSRRIRFHLSLSIHDLNNVPLVSGTSFIKWHLPSSTAAEHRGRTPKCAIKDHRVLYDYTKQLPVRLTMAKEGNVLQSCEVHFQVVQEYSAGGRAGRLVLGEVRLNLAEYCQGDDALPTSPGGTGGARREEGITRRYLMQESKINSTLKLGIRMQHTDGTRDYIAPPLRTAPVFGGIAGIMSAEANNSSNNNNGKGNHTTTAPGSAHGANGSTDAFPDPSASLPTLSTTNREMGEMQDMYRRTLAAYWASAPGELRADECIEDIFSGGDGWGKSGHPPAIFDTDDGKPHEQQQPTKPSGSGSSTPNPDARHHGRNPLSRAGSGGGGGNRGGRDAGSGGDAARGLVSVGGGKTMAYGSKHPKRSKATMPPRMKGAGEVDEFDIREDLRSWSIGAVGRA